MKKLLVCIFIVLGLFCGFSSCTTTNPAGNSNQSESNVVESSSLEVTELPKEIVDGIDYLPIADNVKLLGRSILDGNNQLVFGFSSTGVEFNIHAKALEITVQGDSTARSGNEQDAARIVVFVNGERKLDKLVQQRSATYQVFYENDFIDGVVQVLKVSEVSNSLAVLKKITTDKEGSISPTESKNLKIEFIGDSITCGYGVDDLVSSHHFKTATEDNTKTYAYKTAKTLNADYSMVSLSGWGIISGYTGDGNKVGNMALPPYYSKSGFAWGKSMNGVCLEKTDWDFSRFVPDVVLINLGTNDASYTKGNADRIDEYKNAYVEFIKDIRSKNQNAKIICALGIMGQDLYPAIEAAVSDYKAETGDNSVYSLKFAVQSSGDGIAADWHPSEKTHEKAAKVLVAKIQEILQ